MVPVEGKQAACLPLVMLEGRPVPNENHRQNRATQNALAAILEQGRLAVIPALASLHRGSVGLSL